MTCAPTEAAMSLYRLEKGVEVKYLIFFSFHYSLKISVFQLMLLLDIPDCFHGSWGVPCDIFSIIKQLSFCALTALLRDWGEPSSSKTTNTALPCAPGQEVHHSFGCMMQLPSTSQSINTSVFHRLNPRSLMFCSLQTPRTLQALTRETSALCEIL